MKVSSRRACKVAAVLVAFSLGGCGLWPFGDKEPATVTAKPSTRAAADRASPAPRSQVPLPVRGTLAVFVDPKVNEARAVSSYGLDEKRFNERSMLGEAAMKSFRGIFTQVAPFAEGKDTEALLSLTGDSYYNPIMHTYYVNVRASIYIGDSPDSLGTFKAKAQYDGGQNDPDAFLRAYGKATDDIARQIVASAEFAEALKPVQ
jgi:hypothetical protein